MINVLSLLGALIGEADRHFRVLSSSLRSVVSLLSDGRAPPCLSGSADESLGFFVGGAMSPGGAEHDFFAIMDLFDEEDTFSETLHPVEP